MRTGCFGLCDMGPIVIVYPEGAFYSHVKAEDVDEIVSEHLVKGRIVTRLLYEEAVEEDKAIRLWTRSISIKSRSALRCATAASSIPKRSTNTSPLTATRRWQRF